MNFRRTASGSLRSPSNKQRISRSFTDVKEMFLAMKDHASTRAKQAWTSASIGSGVLAIKHARSFALHQ
jgi:hypothetical protein